MLRFVPPCLPTKSATPPSGPLWLHEIKHDGFRVIACKDGTQVRLYSRPGNDLTKRFPLIVETLAQLRCKSCVIDGEAATPWKSEKRPCNRSCPMPDPAFATTSTSRATPRISSGMPASCVLRGLSVSYAALCTGPVDRRIGSR